MKIKTDGRFIVWCSYYTLSDILQETNNMHRFLPLLYCTYWLLHVLAEACHHQGAYYILLSYLKYKLDGWYIMCGYVACVLDCCITHRPCNHTLYDIPTIQFVFQRTQEDLISSLTMSGYCRNMYKPIHRIKDLIYYTPKKSTYRNNPWIQEQSKSENLALWSQVSH
jgi:hypothetical protein